MADQPHFKLHANETKNGIGLSLRQKLVNSLPPMWRGNQADMPHITHDRLWFLRENRFLFFTRNGPVEITLKPTIVLASAIIGIVGLSVIFFSTIFASYSAIEVMRDETFQTAQASIKQTETNALSTDVMTTLSEEAALWQTNIMPESALSGLTDKIEGKTATSPKPIPSRFNAQPHVNAPSPIDLPDRTVTNKAPTFPLIIKGNDQDTTSPVSKWTEGTLTSDKTPKDTTSVEALNLGLPNIEPTVGLDFDIVTAHQSPGADTISDKKSSQVSNQTADRIITNVSPLELHGSNIAEYANTESAEKDNFVRTAAGFAIAMLPRLFSDPDPTVPKFKPDTILQPEQDSDHSVAGPLDDGFAIIPNNGQAGPLLPSISDAARAQKLLLSVDGEINYIRKSISQLGIKTDYLPRYDTPKTKTKETDFKQLMITLAEHRAALRKIPFKTPMLYFYISSEYGYRKHPKTGKKAFHHGIDLAGTWQENVRSTAPGTVVFAGHEGSFGKVVRIEHDFGISTLYAHLSRITVRVGNYVAENTVIGKMGNTGRSAGSHLHYEIQVDGKSVDPSDFFTIGRQMSVSGELRQTSLTN